MSNRAVSVAYRTIIDDVISNVRQDFEDMGIEREVLEELQRSWEAKLVATGVADFDGAPVVPPRSRRNQQQSSNGTTPASTGNSAGESSSVQVKQEDGVNPTELMGGSGSSNKMARTNGATDVGSVKNGSQSGGSQATGSSAYAEGSNSNGAGMGSSASAMAIEGLLSNGDSGNKRKRPTSDENEIGSDLDDSDEEELDGAVDADGNEDMILCLYDKVQRVRNKWKCILKDGVASIDGRDYVFSKLASELEW